MIEEVIFSILSGDATVAALAGSRGYPLPAPQGGAHPFVTYQRIGTNRARALEGSVGLADVRMQIDCWGQDRAGISGSAEARALATAARKALDGTRGLIAGVQLRASAPQDERHFHEAETRTHRVSLDFMMSHEEG